MSVSTASSVDIRSDVHVAPEARAGVDLVTLQRVSKRFRAKRQWIDAVSDLSLTLRAGEVLALLGPNGSGKTTTIKMIAGLIAPDQGSVSVQGANPHRDRNALRSLGAVLEGGRNVYWRLSAAENLRYFGVLKGLTRREADARGRRLLQEVGLDHRRDAPV